MKLLFASDIHGSIYYCRKLIEAYHREQAEKMILLGDLLYHGPRNDLPREYAPKEVTTLLNANKEELFCVRGNCEAEVDQMVLDFPVMADYMLLFLDGKTAFITHGHNHNLDRLPPLREGDLLIHGHTHVLKAVKEHSIHYLNPGSVSIPKEGNPNSYMIYENNCFTIKTLEGEVILTYEI